MFDEIADEDDPNVANMEGARKLSWLVPLPGRREGGLFIRHMLHYFFLSRDFILATGISKLCEKLELDPLEDIRVLVLLWKLGAVKKPAEINKEEVRLLIIFH